MSSYPQGYWSVFTLLNTCSAVGTCCVSLLVALDLFHVFTAGFAKPGLEIFSKHCESIVTASLAHYAVISYLELSIAPVKISQKNPTVKQIW